ncbi:MAG: HDOD domain-containing protein [Desulfobacterales bacterium]|nr:MAG: HDOD domain-containing protein [Desulfobacterales bacterium]
MPQSVSRPRLLPDRVGSLSLRSRILRNLIQLPPMPNIILKAQEIVADPSSSLKDLANVIEADPGLVARVMTLANSAYFGVSTMVSSIQHASVLLGQKTLGQIITLSASATLLSQRLEGYGMKPEDLWLHSLAASFGAKYIAAKRRPNLVDDAFMAGLLHDTGKILLDPYISENQKVFEALLGDGGRTFLQAEKEVLGFDHAEIMYRASRFWRFPEGLGTAIRYHHAPSLSDENALAYIVHLADILAEWAGFGTGKDRNPCPMDEEALTFLDLQEEELEPLLKAITESVQKIAQEFKGN